MSWQYPCHRNDVTGKQILTKQKPIGHAYGALEELQGKVAVDVDAQIGGLTLSSAYIQNNALVLRGRVSGAGSDLEARVAALETSVAEILDALRNISLVVNLDITSNALTATGNLKIGENYGAVISGGNTVAVESC